MSPKPRFDDPAAREALRAKLAGLGEHSLRKSYYPELQARVAQLERFRALLDHGSEAIFLLELPGATLIDVSESACHQLDTPRERLIGSRMDAHVASECRDALAAALRVTGSDARGTIACRLLRADGSWFPVEMSVRAVRLGERLHAVVVARDTSERDRLLARLALSDRLASVGTLAAGVVHEINNPLSAVVANLDLLREAIAEARERLRAAGGLDGAAARAMLDDLDATLHDAVDGAGRVRRIVRDLKSFARADADPRDPIDVRKVLDSTLRLTASEIRHRAQLHRRYREVPLVRASEGRLTQVFTNLLVNAAQAIPEGAAEEHAITVSTWAEPGVAVVEIADTGSGIPPDLLQRIFDPFFTTKPVGIGTGLGLSICIGIVGQLGGAIDVQSTPGEGTSFRVRLPALDRPADARAEPAPPPPPAPRTARPPLRILLVDDDDLAAGAIARQLSPPHEVIVVPSAREALDRIGAGERPDVILCDLMMPGMGGMEFHAALGAAAPDLAGRVVIVTAGAFTPGAQSFLDEARLPWVEKPIVLTELWAAVDAILAGASGGPPPTAG